ncbi:phage tail tape measure protein, partial [Salmonella enterica]|uniref:phage tail tape measure protein n=1 Tax=Salmonella enterica TaxID=28901 RepID=UPI00092D1F40
MDQIANLVIDLSIDSAEFRNEVPRIKKLLNDAAGDSERSAARMQRFLDKQTEATRRTSASLEQVTASSTAYSSAVEKSAAASTRLAADVDQTRQRVEALGRKLREEQAQSAAVAAAQDRTSAAFYRQIDSVKQLSGGLQELQRIQAQVRQAKGRGDISQGDYLALVSEAAAKTRELTDAEALATQKKAQFIRRLKEQTAVQGLSRTELLRVKAAELGVSCAADVYIRKLDTATKSTHALGLKSAMARREIGVLIGELARGNFGALRGSGITLANRAGWIEQLMSPKGMMLGGLVGGVAAAVYGLGKAYYEGAKESEEFNKQLILTGSYAGKTTGKLNEMAKSLAGNGVTQHDAAGVLTQVVGSGAFTGQAVAMVSRTELLRVKAAELGVSSAADIYIRKLERTGTATHTLGLKSAAARRELGVLAGELARGNFGALRGSGITLANRAGWIEQLMSPKGMMLGGLAGGVAAAVYGLGKAYYEGAKESETFNKQLILTGSYAGKTTGQLNAMAKSLAGNGVTQHDAAGVLAQVVGSGAFTGQAMAMVSRTATRMQENVGQSVDETIRQFKRLRDDPVNAAKELDRTLHFLTATQLEQIRVLGEQGRVADAAKIAMSAYSEEMNKRMGDVHDNLGWIERAWNAVGDAAKWAWDRMLDIGREDTLDEKIATLQEKIARDRKTPWTVSSSQTEYDQQQLNELQEQKRQKDLLDAKAQAERNYQETQKRRNEQNAALNRDNETESLRHQREVARITAMQYADAAVRNAALERENERHKKALSQQAKKPKTYHNDEARRLLLQYSQQQAQTEGQITAAKLSTTEKMTEAHKQLLSFQQRIADLSGKKLTADEQSVLAHKDEIALALQKLDISQQDLQHQNALNELKKKTLTLTSQLADEESRVRQQHAMALATMGMGDQQRGRYEERLKIQQHYQEQLEQLKRDSKAKGTYGSDE